MRDPGRIETILRLLNEIWAKQPDLRFNQLIYILQAGYAQQNGGVGEVREADKVGFDHFHVEDEHFIDYLIRELEKNSL